MNKCIAMLIFGVFMSRASYGNEGLPIKFIQGCEADLNQDGVNDIALLYETSKNIELLVLLSDTSGGYTNFLISRDHVKYLNMYCQYGKQITETISGEGKKNKIKTHVTNGVYLVLMQPESSSRAFYWKDDKFIQVWMSD